MKNLLIFVSLLFVGLLTTGQEQPQPPVPELLFHKTEHNPTFITFTNNMDTGLITPGDWLFASKDGKVYGSGPVKTPLSAIVAFGKDKWDPGFEVGDNIQIGLYDHESNRFLALQGNAISMYDRKPTPLQWQPMAFYSFTINGIGDELGLLIDPVLSKVQVKIKVNTDTIKAGDKVFINAVGSNTKDVMVLVNGRGYVEEVKRWLTGFGWVTHIYTAADDDKTVIINAAGISSFAAEMATEQKLIHVKPKITEPEVPSLDPVIFRSDEYGFKIEKRPIVSRATKQKMYDILYIVAEDDIDYRAVLNKSDGSKSGISGKLKFGEERNTGIFERNGVKVDSIEFIFINQKRVSLTVDLQ